MQTSTGGSETLVPLLHHIGTRDGTLTKDARMVNAMPEQAEVGKACVKRPGTVLSKTPAIAGKGQGMVDLAGIPYAIVKDTLQQINGSGSITIPGVTTPDQLYQTISNYAPGKSLIKSASGMWLLTAPNAIVKVTAAGYPTTTLPGVTMLDGTTYVMNAADGTIAGSAVNDPSSWNALNFIGADGLLGAGVGIERHLNYIVGCYDLGMQLFYDAANATGSPLAPVLNASWRTGVATAGSIVELGDNFFCMSKAGPRGRSILMFSGLQPTEISNPYIDKILNRDSLVGVRSFGIRTAGHSFYLLTLDASNVSLVYDVTYQHWSVWTSSLTGVEAEFFAGSYLNSNGCDYLQDAVTGTVHCMLPDAYTDSGSPIPVTIHTPPYDWGTLHRKLLPSLYLIADTVATTVTMAWSDNDYATFTNGRTIALNTERKMLQRCGSSRRRSWRLTHSDNTSLRVYSLELEIALNVA